MHSKPTIFSSSTEESSDEESHSTLVSSQSSRMLCSYPKNGPLIASLALDEGHVYSLAAKNNVLYSGSDKRIIRVWSNMQEFAAFKCKSGFVKSIVVFNDKIFTGHQDGKIRVWKVNEKNPRLYKLSETLPTLLDVFKNSMKPSGYVQVRRHHTRLWVKHNDAISSLSINQEKGLLYSSSWDKTFKVWNIRSSTCVESIKAHKDAINSIASNSDHVYTGSADGTLKVWKLEQNVDVKGAATIAIKHVLVQTLPMNRCCSVTAVAVNMSGSMAYAGSSSGAVNYWAVERGCGLLRGGGVLKGHDMAVLCVATGGDDLVLSGSADKTVRVWKRAGGVHASVAVLTGHVGPVKCLAVEEDGGGEWVVYSGSLDKSVKVWRVRET